jgi:hypothetical protein
LGDDNNELLDVVKHAHVSYQMVWSTLGYLENYFHIAPTSSLELSQWLLLIQAFVKCKLFANSDEVYNTGKFKKCPKLMLMIRMLRNHTDHVSLSSHQVGLYSNILYRIMVEDEYPDDSILRNYQQQEDIDLSRVLIRFEYQGLELGTIYLTRFTTIQVSNVLCTI